jgi:hypothetical protein
VASVHAALLQQKEQATCHPRNPRRIGARARSSNESVPRTGWSSSSGTLAVRGLLPRTNEAPYERGLDPRSSKLEPANNLSSLETARIERVSAGVVAPVRRNYWRISAGWWLLRAIVSVSLMCCTPLAPMSGACRWGWPMDALDTPLPTRHAERQCPAGGWGRALGLAGAVGHRAVITMLHGATSGRG